MKSTEICFLCSIPVVRQSTTDSSGFSRSVVAYAVAAALPLSCMAGIVGVSNIMMIGLARTN